MSEYTARAVRWEHGWELHVEGVGVTQVRTLDAAEQQVRDLIETMLEVTTDDSVVHIIPELGGLAEAADEARDKAAAAGRLQVAAASETRKVVAALRAMGLSVSDIAWIMDISRGRASQLLVTKHRAG